MRDGALADAAKARAELAAALKQLAAVTAQRNAAQTKEADDAVRTIATEPAAVDALADLNRLSVVPPADPGRAGAAAGADHGHAGPDAVPAAVATEASGPGGDARSNR
jgi:hypothetical protein